MKLNFKLNVMNKRNVYHLFSKVLRNDRVGEPAPEIEDRLMYSFLLKSSASKPRQNSLAGFAGWFFSAKGFGLKTALVSIVLFFSMFNSPFTFDSAHVSASDSITNQSILIADTSHVLVADTAHFIQSINSSRTDSLN